MQQIYAAPLHILNASIGVTTPHGFRLIKILKCPYRLSVITTYSTNTRHVCTYLNAFFMVIINIVMQFNNVYHFLGLNCSALGVICSRLPHGILGLGLTPLNRISNPLCAIALLQREKSRIQLSQLQLYLDIQIILSP